MLDSVPGEGEVSLVAAFSKEVNGKGLQAGNFIIGIAKLCGGGGSGRDPSQLAAALKSAKVQLIEGLG